MSVRESRCPLSVAFARLSEPGRLFLVSVPLRSADAVSTMLKVLRLVVTFGGATARRDLKSWRVCHYSASQRRRMPGSSATLVPETGVQRDWEEREFAQSIQLGIKSLAQFLNEFGLR